MNALVSSWFTSNKDKFTPQHQAVIQSKLEDLTDDKAKILASTELKDPTMMLIIDLFVGVLGVHRFMLGETGVGIICLLSGGVCGIIPIIDLFTITQKTREYNFKQVLPFL